MSLTPNSTILNSKYHILRLIGAGGITRIWLAAEIHLDHQIALKKQREAHPQGMPIDQVITVAKTMLKALVAMQKHPQAFVPKGPQKSLAGRQAHGVCPGARDNE